MKVLDKIFGIAELQGAGHLGLFSAGRRDQPKKN